MIEKQLTEFKKSEVSLIQPFKFITSNSRTYSLQVMIFEFWHTFRIVNENMKKIYTANVDIVKKYLIDNKVNYNYLGQLDVYKSFEKICMKYIIDTPKKYVVIKFVDDNECVYLVKRDGEFKLLAGKFREISNISKLFKENSFKDVEEINDYTFVVTFTLAYDEITDTELVHLFN